MEQYAIVIIHRCHQLMLLWVIFKTKCYDLLCNFVMPAPLCNFLSLPLIPASFSIFLPHFVIFELSYFVNTKPVHFVIILFCFIIICRINLGMFLHIFDNLAIFPRKFSHGEGDRRVLHFRSLAVEKTQITFESLISVYQYKYFIW